PIAFYKLRADSGVDIRKPALGATVSVRGCCACSCYIEDNEGNIGKIYLSKAELSSIMARKRDAAMPGRPQLGLENGQQHSQQKKSCHQQQQEAIFLPYV